MKIKTITIVSIWKLNSVVWQADRYAAITVLEYCVVECGHTVAAFGSQGPRGWVVLELLRIIGEGLRVAVCGV